MVYNDRIDLYGQKSKLRYTFCEHLDLKDGTYLKRFSSPYNLNPSNLFIFKMINHDFEFIGICQKFFHS